MTTAAPTTFIPRFDGRRDFVLEIAGVTLAVRELRGKERLSTPFRFEVECAIAEGSWKATELVRTAATLHWVEGTPELPARRLRSSSGFVTGCRVKLAGPSGRALFVTLEPPLALARLRVDFRSFLGRTVPEIAEEVLARHGVELEHRLVREYPRRPYTVQCRESDLAFVSRLLEAEGIYSCTDEGGVVLGDHPGAYESSEKPVVLAFRSEGALVHDVESVSSLARRSGVVPARVTRRDWNFEKPRLDMDVSAWDLGIEDYAYPGGYDAPASGLERAGLERDAFSFASASTVGRTSLAAARPGVVIRIVEAPAIELDRDVAIVGLEYEWSRQGAPFVARFEAIDGTIAFRPPRVTPVPKLRDPLTARVAAPAGADVYTDGWGRALLAFPWDRSGRNREHKSHWFPVVQDNTGHSSGIARTDWEVLVDFLHADPDYPIVLGRLYNGADPMPEELPRNKTISELRSLTSPRGPTTPDSGTNMIQLEDLAEEERIWVHAERDQRVLVANDKAIDVLDLEADIVQRDETIRIGGDHRATIGNDMSLEVDGSQRWSVGGDRVRTVGASEAISVTEHRITGIGGGHERTITSEDDVATGSLCEFIAGAVLETCASSHSLRTHGTGSHTVGGSLYEMAAAGRSESASNTKSEYVAGMCVTIASGETKTRINHERSTTIDKNRTVFSKNDLSLVGKEETAVSANAQQWTARRTVTFKIGATEVGMRQGLIELKTKRLITIRVTERDDLGARLAKLISP